MISFFTKWNDFCWNYHTSKHNPRSFHASTSFVVCVYFKRFWPYFLLLFISVNVWVFQFSAFFSVNSKLCRNSCTVKLPLFSQLPHFHVKKGHNHIFCKLYIIIHLELRSLIDGFQSKFFHILVTNSVRRKRNRKYLWSFYDGKRSFN